MPNGDSGSQERFDLVGAPSPHDRTKWTKLQISKARVASYAGHRQLNKLFEVFYQVLGVVPPVDNIGYHEREAGCFFADNWGGIRHAHALFRGIRRPYITEPNGETIFTYIVRPRYVYKYVPSMVCRARREDAPKNAVFVIYARFDEQEFGEIVGWEWVFSDHERPDLPENFRSRYDEQIW